MAGWEFKINMKQLPIKAHYFFFMAAMGPILPFLSVYGKDLGISPVIMGSVTAVLPLLYLISKPIFGFLVDYFRNYRKFIFILILVSSSFSLVLMQFMPHRSQSLKNSNETLNSTDNKTLCDLHQNITSINCFDNQTINYPNDYTLYKTSTFWIYVLLLSIGSIGYNVSNSLSDAICFDVLGEGGHMGYGRQRVWGTIGFGISAFFAGYMIDLFSRGQAIKSYTPAFILVITFTIFDVICCQKLELPIISGSKNIAKDVVDLLKRKTIALFLVFATIAGILDSFIIYFLFWYLEDLAQATNHMEKIKLIEGLIIAAETLGGEVIFFSLSGKILKKFGYGYSMTFCFICYSLRLGLISLAPNPWWVVPIELLMQGPTYALCYTIIVGFASVIAPPGTSATVQGIIAGMDDGFGFAVGSLVGGILYKKFGGPISLRIFSTLAAVTAVAYLIIYLTILKAEMPQRKKNNKNVTEVYDHEYKTPEDAVDQCQTA